MPPLLRPPSAQPPPSPDHTLLHQPNYSTSCRLVTSNRSIAFELPTTNCARALTAYWRDYLSLLFYNLRGYKMALTVYATVTLTAGR